MKSIYKKSFIPVALLSITMLLGSCLNDLNIDPVNPNVSTTFYQDEVFAKIYSSLALTGQKGPDGIGDVAGIDEGTSAFVRLLWNLNELTSDEAMCSWGDPGIPEMNFNSWSSSHSNVKGLYGRLYFNITLINEFLTRIEGKTDEKTVRQRAEARFMRALNYYYLLDMFKDVPFTEKVTINEPPKPISRENLFKYLNKELAECEKDMFAPGESKPYYRVNKVANWMLRSRVYLNAEVYTGTAKWDSAAIFARKVIEPTSGYSLCPTFRHLFMADNAGIVDGSSVNQAPNEIIFPIAADGVQTKSWGSTIFLIASTHTGDMPGWGTTEGWGGNRARAALVNKFFSGNAVFSNNNDLTTAKAPTLSLKDARALFLKGGVTINAVDGSDSIKTTARTKGIVSNTFKEGYSVIKFSNLRADGAKTTDIQFIDTDFPLMRQAEAYLTYAEAITRGASPIDGLTALQAVNTLRTRAGKTTALTSLTLQNIIDEWAREFFFEGRRRSDLIRFGHYGGNNTGYTWDWKGGESTGKDFSEIYNVFPIPASELNVNPNLKPTAGY